MYGDDDDDDDQERKKKLLKKSIQKKNTIKIIIKLTEKNHQSLPFTKKVHRCSIL
jgi:hypothetical protein